MAPLPPSAIAKDARRRRGRTPARAWPLIAVAITLGVPCPAAPEVPEDPSLAAIREEVERLRSELQSFDERREGFVGRLERLSVERLLLEEEVRALEVERRRAEQEIAASRTRSQVLAGRLEEQRGRLAAALREAYKMGRLRHYRLILEVQDPQELTRAYRYISDWSRADADRIEEFRRTAAALDEEQRSLEGRIADLAANHREREARRGKLEENRDAQDEALARLEKERGARQSALLELEEAAGRLESLIAGLPPGERLPVDGRLVDLEALRGHLPWPVDGAIVLPFGTVEHPRFRTLTPHDGIDLAVPEGTPVRPVFGGTVVYADWFRGYGRTVIVDHGGGIVSVYAHLRSLEVSAGDLVDPDTVLGPSGSTGSLRGPVLYLEIRRHGDPEDPAAWLRPHP